MFTRANAPSARITVVEAGAPFPFELSTIGVGSDHAVILQDAQEPVDRLTQRFRCRAREFLASGVAPLAVTVSFAVPEPGMGSTQNRIFMVSAFAQILASGESRLRLIARGAGPGLRHELVALAGALRENGITRAMITLDFNGKVPQGRCGVRPAVAASQSLLRKVPARSGGFSRCSSAG